MLSLLAAAIFFAGVINNFKWRHANPGPVFMQGEVKREPARLFGWMPWDRPGFALVNTLCGLITAGAAIQRMRKVPTLRIGATCWIGVVAMNAILFVYALANPAPGSEWGFAWAMVGGAVLVALLGEFKLGRSQQFAVHPLPTLHAS